MIKKFFKNLSQTLYKNSAVIMIIATLCVVLSVGYTTMYAEVTYTAKAEVILYSPSLTETTQYSMVKPDIPTIDNSLEIFNSRSMYTFLTDTELSEKNYTADELDEKIEVTRRDKKSLILIVTVTCDDEDEATELLKAYTTAMSPFFASFTMDFSVKPLSVDEDAVINTPSVALTVVMALIGGGLLGSVAVVILDKFNKRLRGVSDYKARYSVTLLGEVPDFSVKKEDK